MRKNWEFVQSGISNTPCLYDLAERSVHQVYIAVPSFFSHWDSGMYLVCCTWVVWVLCIPTCIEQSHLPRLDHHESSIFECHPQMVLVGEYTLKKQDMQSCSCLCPVVPTPVAAKRQVQSEQNFNCLSKRHHCNTCFKSQGNKCQSYKLPPVFCQIIVSWYVLYLKVTLTSICNIYELGTAKWVPKLLGFWELDVLLMSFYLPFMI